MPAWTSSRLIWLLMLSVAIVGSNSLALSPILADVARDLGSNAVEVARASVAYGGATALSALLLGGLIDRHGPRPVLAGALGALSLAMLASAAALHWAWLAAAQGAAGVAAGLVLPATYALATSSAPQGRGAQVLGRVLTGWSLSLVAGVPLSAFIAGALSWRASYGLLAFLLAGAALALSGSRDATGRTGEACSESGSPLAAWHLPGVAPLLATCFLFMTGFYGAYAYLGDAVRRGLGLTAVEAGSIVLAYGVGFGFASLGDRFIDRVGIKRLFPAVLGGVAVVYGLMIVAIESLAGITAVAALWGVLNHFGLNMLVLQLGRAGTSHKGSVLALNSAVTYLGALVGAGLFGPLYESFGFGSVAGLAGACTGGAALIAALSASRSRSLPQAEDRTIWVIRPH